MHTKQRSVKMSHVIYGQSANMLRKKKLVFKRDLVVSKSQYL